MDHGRQSWRFGETGYRVSGLLSYLHHDTPGRDVQTAFKCSDRRPTFIDMATVCQILCEVRFREELVL
jgi:hypothetical protein